MRESRQRSVRRQLLVLLLTAVSVACLTLYDMLKAADRAMVIGPIRLARKTKRG